MTEFTVRLPDVGEGVAEAEIVEWHIAVGDTVDEDAVMVDVMSDKATIELPSPVTGTVRWVAGDAGDVIAVGSDLVVIDVDGGTDVAAGDVEPAPAITDSPVSQSEAVPVAADRAMTSDTRPTAAPAVRARAHDLGIELASVTGTGPDGRITHRDLDAVLRSDARRPSLRPATPAGSDGIDEVKVTGLRRNIAERMQASKRRIPHFTYVEEVDVTEVERLRHELNVARTDGQPKLSLLPFLMRAVVLAVRTHPDMNARFDDDELMIRRHRSVHLGIAVQTDRGLMVPVVHHADTLDVWASAGEVARLAEEARTAKISLDDLTGSTVTITSLGALGGVVSTPVINSPEVAIVGVNKIVDRPVYVGDELVRRQMLNLSSSFDHRVIDGADAAAFVQTVRQKLETPALLFI